MNTTQGKNDKQQKKKGETKAKKKKLRKNTKKM